MVAFSQNPLLEKLIVSSESDPDKKIIIETSGNSITTQQLLQDSTTVASNLLIHGFKKGDRVLLLVQPGVDLVIFVIAVLQIGGVLVVADPGMGKEVFLSRVNIAQPKWIFAESLIFFLTDHPLLKFVLRKRGFDIPEVSSLRTSKIIRHGVVLPGTFHSLSFSSLLKKTLMPRRANALSFTMNDEAMIVFTSGTTQLPKGVVHTIGSLLASIKKIEYITTPQKNDVFYAALSQFLLLSVALAVPVIVPKNKFSPQQFLNDLKKWKPTVLFGPPAEFIGLVKVCQKEKKKLPSSINKVIIGSAPVLSGFLQKLLPILSKNTSVLCMYGMTEIIPIAVVDGRKKSVWKGSGDLIGKILPGIAFTILADGELVLKGDNLFKNYLGQKKAQAVHTGDIVNYVKDQIVMIGRKKDMIIRDNYNIYPGLYESTIEKISGVAACAMVGIRDEKKRR